MEQHYFSEVNPRTYFPDGHETYFNGLNRLAEEWFPDSWHGDHEFRMRHQEYDASVSDLAVDGARLIMALTHTKEQMAEISDAEIVDSLLADRTDEQIAELEAPLRYRELVTKLRKALINSELSIAALANDGSDEPLPSQFWKSNLAEAILYSGTCIVSDGRFVSHKDGGSSPTRYLIFNSESINAFIAHRSSRPELSKDEIFSEAVRWLSEKMRKSPSRRPAGMTNAESRQKFNKIFGHNIKERAWDKIWKISKEAEGAQAWSKPGPTKVR